MKRDDVVLPIETEPKPTWQLDPVREGMNHYYWRNADELRKLLERLVRAAETKEEK